MEDCIFCKIISGEIPSKIVYENEHVCAFRDASPEAPEHILVVPKKHYSDITELDNSEILSELFKAVNKIAKDVDPDEKGFRLVINTGDAGGQTVKHLHIHLLAGRNFKWPAG